MYWGAYSGWLIGLFRGSEDPYRAQLDFLSTYGLNVASLSARSLLAMDAGRREEIAGWLEELDIYSILGIGFDYFAEDPDEIKRGTDSVLETLETLPKMMRTLICSTGDKKHHRWTRNPSLPEQLDHLSRVLAPVAKAAHQAGTPVGWHNSVRYPSDIAELCRRTPHLGILYDTGNPFHVGERPLDAAQAVAPYTVGLHVKDHYVAPVWKPILALQLTSAVPGSGDVMIKEVYDIIVQNVPDRDRLVVEIEIDPIEGMRPEKAVEKAVAFVRTL
jgi:sugar phosphate isomerase/epimerase